MKLKKKLQPIKQKWVMKISLPVFVFMKKGKLTNHHF